MMWDVLLRYYETFFLPKSHFLPNEMLNVALKILVVILTCEAEPDSTQLISQVFMSKDN